MSSVTPSVSVTVGAALPGVGSVAVAGGPTTSTSTSTSTPLPGSTSALVEQVHAVLAKTVDARTYDDILLFKQYLAKTEYGKKHLSFISSNQFDEICRSMVLESFAPADVVFNQGDINDKLFFVLSGRCEIKVRYKVELSNGESEVRDKVTGLLEAGMHFGERGLEQDEPSAATISCGSDCYTELISIARRPYQFIMYQSDEKSMRGISKDSKDFVMRVLAKARTRRSGEDIEVVASYLGKRVKFFQRFSTDHRLELCRVCESLSMWGKHILFKQGALGQAFYVVLTGSVQVFVGSNAASRARLESHASEEGTSPNKGGPSDRKMAGKSIFDTFGDLVATLQPGDIFGERALENDSSQRMATVVTCDDLTELVVISKDDYFNLVSVMLESSSMEKIQLLRKTAVFGSIDMNHLRYLAKYMTAKRFHLNEILYRRDDDVSDLIIIDVGECRAEVYADSVPTSTIETNTATGTNHTVTEEHTAGDQGLSQTHAHVSLSNLRRLKGTQVIKLGRIAPYSVLGLSLLVNWVDLHSYQGYHNETVVASSLVTAYYINKVDLFSHVPKLTRDFLVQVARRFSAPVTQGLWDMSPKVASEDDWRITQAWSDFRGNLVEKKKNSNIVENFRVINEFKLVIGSNRKHTSTSSGFNSSSGTQLMTTRSSAQLVSSDWGTASALERDRQYRKGTPSIQLEAIRLANQQRSQSTIISPVDDDPHVLKALSNGRLRLQSQRREAPALVPLQHISPSRPASGLSNQEAESATVVTAFSLPFSLVQIHREAQRARDGLTGGAASRLVRCFMRICGKMASCADAQSAATQLMRHAFLTMFDGDLRHQDELELHWQAFHGFEALPMQSSDIFVVYCRGVPTEYASLTPSRSLLLHDLPVVCKQPGQAFACVVVNPLPSLPTVRPLIVKAKPKGKYRRKQGKGNRATLKGRNLNAKKGEDGFSDDDSSSDDDNDEAFAEFASTVSTSIAIDPTSVFRAEIAMVREVLVTYNTRYECLRHAAVELRDSAERDELRRVKHVAAVLNHTFNDSTSATLNGDNAIAIASDTQSDRLLFDGSLSVFPLYDWLLINAETIRAYLCTAGSGSGSGSGNGSGSSASMSLGLEVGGTTISKNDIRTADLANNNNNNNTGPAVSTASSIATSPYADASKSALDSEAMAAIHVTTIVSNGSEPVSNASSFLLSQQTPDELSVSDILAQTKASRVVIGVKSKSRRLGNKSNSNGTEVDAKTGNAAHIDDCRLVSALGEMGLPTHTKTNDGDIENKAKNNKEGLRRVALMPANGDTSLGLLKEQIDTIEVNRLVAKRLEDIGNDSSIVFAALPTVAESPATHTRGVPPTNVNSSVSSQPLSAAEVSAALTKARVAALLKSSEARKKLIAASDALCQKESALVTKYLGSTKSEDSNESERNGDVSAIRAADLSKQIASERALQSDVRMGMGFVSGRMKMYESLQRPVQSGSVSGSNSLSNTHNGQLQKSLSTHSIAADAAASGRSKYKKPQTQALETLKVGLAHKLAALENILRESQT